VNHTESTINYLCNYLYQFHKMKGVFLHFWAQKATRAKAEVVEQELKKQREARQQELDDLSTAQYAQMHHEDQLECCFLINQVLENKSDFNFPKIYLSSHYTGQISWYGSLA